MRSGLVAFFFCDSFMELLRMAQYSLNEIRCSWVEDVLS